MAKDVLVIDFDGKFIKILTGNKNLVKYTDIIEVDEADLTNGEITNYESVASVLGIYIKEKKIREKDLLISIHEPDTIIRHMEVPIMEERAIREAIQYETNQYLPQNGVNHYIDYEIVEKIETDDKKVYNLLVVAVTKVKIDKYVELSKKLKLNLKTIDIGANCIARTFKGISNANKDMPNVGIIDINSKNSSLIVLQNGKLFIEREIPFGVDSLVKDICTKMTLKKDDGLEYLMKEFSFLNKDKNIEIQKKFRAQLETVLSSFAKVIQFSTTGMEQKKLNQIYVIGEGSKINGISELISEYFETPTLVAHSAKEVKLNIKFKSTYDLVLFSNAVGLLLSEPSRRLNLLPLGSKKTGDSGLLNSKNKKIGIITILILVILAIIPRVYLVKLDSDASDLKLQVDKGKPVLTENITLTSKISDIKQYTQKLNEITKDKIMVGDRLRELLKNMPIDVSFLNLDYSKDVFILSCTTGNYNSINQFLAKLQTAKVYKSADISGIMPDKSSGKYNFSITVNYPDLSNTKKN